MVKTRTVLFDPSDYKFVGYKDSKNVLFYVKDLFTGYYVLIQTSENSSFRKIITDKQDNELLRTIQYNDHMYFPKTRTYVEVYDKVRKANKIQTAEARDEHPEFFI